MNPNDYSIRFMFDDAGFRRHEVRMRIAKYSTRLAPAAFEANIKDMLKTLDSSDLIGTGSYRYQQQEDDSKLQMMREAAVDYGIRVALTSDARFGYDDDEDINMYGIPTVDYENGNAVNAALHEVVAHLLAGHKWSFYRQYPRLAEAYRLRDALPFAMLYEEGIWKVSDLFRAGADHDEDIFRKAAQNADERGLIRSWVKAEHPEIGNKVNDLPWEWVRGLLVNQYPAIPKYRLEDTAEGGASNRWQAQHSDWIDAKMTAGNGYFIPGVGFIE